jgi:hypothetical protein
MRLAIWVFWLVYNSTLKMEEQNSSERFGSTKYTTLQPTRPYFVRFEVSTATSMSKAVFWDVTPGSSGKN